LKYILICTPPSNCLTERSLSTLKRVKTYLRSIIGENRLNSLAILNIVVDLTKTINFNDIIEAFASQKSRKKLLAIDYFIIYN
jgi:cell division protein ZapA (FtsZ GTPase activity inhibitor)